MYIEYYLIRNVNLNIKNVENLNHNIVKIIKSVEENEVKIIKDVIK